MNADRSQPTFTTDDIALAIEIREIYDGTAVYLLKDGTLVNRFAGSSGWGVRAKRVDKWITAHGDQVRANNADLLNLTPFDEEVAL